MRCWCGGDTVGRKHDYVEASIGIEGLFILPGNRPLRAGRPDPDGTGHVGGSEVWRDENERSGVVIERGGRDHGVVFFGVGGYRGVRERVGRSGVDGEDMNLGVDRHLGGVLVVEGPALVALVIPHADLVRVLGAQASSQEKQFLGMAI